MSDIYAGAISAEKKHKIFGETIMASALALVLAKTPKEALEAVTTTCFERYPESEWHRHDTMIAIIPKSIILDAGYITKGEITE